MATEIYLCLDLGNDTLKVSFAYESQHSEHYGKLMLPNLINQVALPAAACYDQDAKEWYYAEELEEARKECFFTVVKIKSLLTMFTSAETEEEEKQNRTFYTHEHYFPKFSFPVRRKLKDDFQYMVDQKLVFEAPKDTPRSVCEGFFKHVRKTIEACIADLSKQTGISFSPIQNIALVYPPKHEDKYVEEMVRLIRFAFGVKPTKILPATQALGLFAFHQGLLNDGERILFFDMGDETVSVTKAWLNEIGQNLNNKSHDNRNTQAKMGILIDSPEGHLKPLDLGGEDLDEAIAAYLENCIHDRETVGSPSVDVEGHIFENGLTATQYLLMKDIKKAKMVMPLAGEGIFKDGVPISIHRETLVQRLLTADAFDSCMGTDRNVGVAQRVLSYVLDELKRPVNRDVTKVLFAGGLIESRGLLQFLTDKIRLSKPKIKVITFKNESDDGDDYSIRFNEMSTYASSIGGAIVAMKNYSVDAVLSYSYGTWLYHGDDKKHLKLFANRGDLLLKDENRFAIEATVDVGRRELEYLEGDELFSTVINMQEIKDHAYADSVVYDGDWLLIGDQGDSTRRLAEDAIALRVVAGGKGTEIHFYYHNERVSISSNTPQLIYFEEGFVVDKKGLAQPFFSNLRKKNNIEVTVHGLRTNLVKQVNARDIEFHLCMNTIKVTTNT